MNEPITFFIACAPPSFTAQQKGAFAMPGGKGVRFFKKPEAVAAERTWMGLLHGHAPKQPFQGPVRLALWLYYPWRKSEKKSVIRDFSQMPIETRPDIENVAKLAIDVMTTLRFFNDDAQIAWMDLGKWYRDKPGIHVEISPLTGEKRTEELAPDFMPVTEPATIAEPPRAEGYHYPQEPTSPFDI